MAGSGHFATLLLLDAILICGAACGRAAPDDSAAHEPATAQPDKKEVPGIIRAMSDAHGGLDRWASAPTVSFEDHFIPAGASSGQPSRVTVEQGRRRTYIDFPDTEMRMAWDGEQAWSENWIDIDLPALAVRSAEHFPSGHLGLVPGEFFRTLCSRACLRRGVGNDK